MAKLEMRHSGSERVVVLMPMKTRKELDKVAMVHRTSLSRTIVDAVTKYLEMHQDDIQRYNAFFGEE